MRAASLLLCVCVCFALLAVACDDSGEGGSGGGSGGSPALSLAPPSVPDADEGVAYLATFTVSGGTGPFVWGFSGTLPPGLALDLASTTASSDLVGTPTAAGSFSFMVTVNDGVNAASRLIALTVNAAPVTGLTITSTTLGNATVNQPYSAQLLASGAAGPLTWTLAGGVLPFGVTLSSSGLVSGTPTITGAWPFTAEVTDGIDTDSRAFTLTVAGVTGAGPLEQQLRQMIQQQNIVGLGPQNVPNLNPQQVELGRLLFFDKVLSGNNDVACATCHHPSFATGDALNLSVGVGGTGLGSGRTHPSNVFIARNAQPIFNIGMFPELFWDKRVGRPPQAPPPPGSPPPPPPQTQTPEGPSVLAPDEAQALFPIVDLLEMRGTGHALDGLSNADYRLALVNRLAALPEYVNRFNAAFGAAPTVDNMGRAIAAYERSQTFVNAPWDRYLRGENNALTDAQKRGAMVFFGRANCDSCHGGPLLTNFSTHNLGIPQFGPGRGNGTGTEDFGFENTTGNAANRYQFRVPSLRNVAFTGPYMHNGAFSTLDEVILHYRNKAASSNAFTGTGMIQGAVLAPTLLPTNNVLANLSPLFTQVPGDLTQNEMNDLRAFLQALTDPAAINRTQEIPQSVPSGLPVDR